MNVVEQIKNHSLYALAVFLIPIIGSVWFLAEKLRVTPIKERIEWQDRQISSFKEQKADMEKQVATLKEHVAAQDRQISSLQDQVAALSQKNKELNELVARRSEVPTPTPIEAERVAARHKDSPLIINGTAYQMPTSSSPYCVAQEIYTGYNNIVRYDIVVPDGWVMMWDSWKAKWDGGGYNNNGILIIRGPYSGKIEINTGGSCSGPIEWYDFILENRRKDYPVPSRPEYTIPNPSTGVLR